jgi:hypothetical protein
MSGGTMTTATAHAPDLPNNVYADRAPAVSLIKNVSETERARIQWAWMADSRGDATKKAVQGIDRSQVRPELLDVVRMMSSCTIETQTVEPSYVMRMNNVKMETERHRSIATQIGEPREKSSKAAQVVEADIVRSSRRGLQLYSMEDAMMSSSPGGDSHGARGRDSATSPRSARMIDARDESGYLIGDMPAEGSTLYSQYRPTCDIPYTSYPVFMPDARAQGVANRYGYISLPQQIVPLPPRRRKKFIAPTDVPYLYGSHDLVLDDRTTTHLQRAHSLWSQSAGFVPKY